MIAISPHRDGHDALVGHGLRPFVFGPFRSRAMVTDEAAG
jgi:hypothetical protein